MQVSTNPTDIPGRTERGRCYERHADPDRCTLRRPFHRLTLFRCGETSILFDLFDPAGRGIDVYFFLLSLRCDQFYFVHELAMFLV